MLVQLVRDVVRGEAVEIAPGRGPVGRYRATVELDCRHVVEVDYKYSAGYVTSRARARAQAVALATESDMVCPRCPLP